MPVLWLHSIAGLLLSLASSLIGKILIAVGVGGVTYTGISAVFAQLTDLIFSQGGAISGPVGQILPMFHLDAAANMVVSAATAKATLNGLTVSGSLYKWHYRKPSDYIT